MYSWLVIATARHGQSSPPRFLRLAGHPLRWTLLSELARSDRRVGELCALYKTLALLPDSKRFVWRAGEGCRSSMKAVFESVACDSPLPLRHFDDVAWRQMLIKALFVEAPLARVFGLATRLDAETARMALDLADERRSAGRPVNPDTWLLVGKHAGARGVASLERELASGSPAGTAAAAEALAKLR